jgi:acyl carrier protein
MSIRDELRSDMAGFLEQRVGVNPEEVSEEKDLYSDLGLDSLDLLAMAQGIQGKYSVSLESESIASVRTVGDMLGFVEQRVSDESSTNHDGGQ